MQKTNRPILLRLLGLLLLLAWSASGAAQSLDTREDTSSLAQGAAMPAWVVPVLRLVSATHVQPTTGIVISDSGLVLVPAGFASRDDEIIVLDGGTDIVRHGRTARLERDFFTQGLQVLRVSGLQRRAAPFADEELQDGMEIRLAAFPPAEQIAEGAAPLNTPATVVVFGESGQPAISGETPLPNVTGALLDACGNLAAYSVAHELQSMQTHPGTRYKWRMALFQVLDELRLAPAPSACRAEPALAEPAAEPEPEPTPPPEPESPPEPEPELPSEENGDTAAEQEAVEEEIPAEPETGAFQPPDEALELEVLPPFEEHRSGQEISEEDKSSRAWIWLLLAAVLIAAGFGLHRLRKSIAHDIGEEGLPGDPLAPPPPGQDSDAGPSEPESEAVLLLNGVLADGSRLEASCPVSANAVNVIIGRGNADLRIPSQAVSRLHASLNGTDSALTLTDLGSNNGTSINGVPCLEGEIMYVQAGDTITLGDARFTFELKPSGNKTKPV